MSAEEKERGREEKKRGKGTGRGEVDTVLYRLKIVLRENVETKRN